MHHVGGRDGTRAFPIVPEFEHDVVSVIYDADPDCLDQVRERNKQLGSKCVVLPYCLAGKTEQVVFHLNYDPYTSSLMEADPRYSTFSMFHRGADYVLGESLKTMERRSVDAVSFDDLFSRDDAGAPPPDFLSLDTQGSEYEILLGARRVLRENVVAVVAEVEFHPIYCGQKLFGDVSRLLAECGYHFVDFLSEGSSRCSPVRLSVGLRSGGFLISSNALFLRDADSLDRESDPARRYAKLCKLAFISIVLGQFDYGVDCLRRARPTDGGVPEVEELSPHAYYRFLKELAAVIATAPLCHPPTFAQQHSFEASRSRFEGVPERPSFLYRLREFVRRKPRLWGFALRVHARTLPFMRFFGIRKRLRLNRRDFPFWGYSRVERLLLSYGLRGLARSLRQCRRLEELYCTSERSEGPRIHSGER